MKNLVRKIFRDRKGATAIEYGLIIALVVLAMMSALTGLASTTIDMWNDVSTKVVQAS